MTDTSHLIAYKRLPNWTRDTIPEAIKQKHHTKEGTWAKLTILSGQLTYIILDDHGEIRDSLTFTRESNIPFIPPKVCHRIEAMSDDLECFLTFYCQKEDYFNKKYGLTRTHSEVISIAPMLPPTSKILDLGSGQGRNSLYLSLLGHEVTAVDANGQSLVMLEDIAETEQLNCQIDWYDINTANLTDMYDTIISTVVFMFLNPDAVPDIISDMKVHTQIGGYNLIVSAMDTESHPCTMPFSFTFKEGELADYYKDWDILSYNENLGELHKRDENGNRIQLQFATLLAKKPNP